MSTKLPGTDGVRGRRLARYSGREPLLRVMIEGERQAEVGAWARRIVDAVRAETGEQE